MMGVGLVLFYFALAIAAVDHGPAPWDKSNCPGRYGPDAADISALMRKAVSLLGKRAPPPCGVAAFALSSRK